MFLLLLLSRGPTCIPLSWTPAVTDSPLALISSRDGTLQLRATGDTEGSLCSSVQSDRGGTVHVEPGEQYTIYVNLRILRITQYIMLIFGQVFFLTKKIVRLVFMLDYILATLHFRSQNVSIIEILLLQKCP